VKNIWQEGKEENYIDDDDDDDDSEPEGEEEWINK
jgi:hypothetical protein